MPFPIEMSPLQRKGRTLVEEVIFWPFTLFDIVFDRNSPIYKFKMERVEMVDHNR